MTRILDLQRLEPVGADRVLPDEALSGCSLIACNTFSTCSENACQTFPDTQL